ncbi:hypothetical protein GCM10022399_17120 [Terrabacter ginsenosidimutans]|uniref:Uncharacterized protein n=1 Tax=Terrabacter ginsenosidimutans TaxID=490575 RepID=A0ABP7D8U5_9MICO
MGEAVQSVSRSDVADRGSLDIVASDLRGSRVRATDHRPAGGATGTWTVELGLFRHPPMVEPLSGGALGPVPRGPWATAFRMPCALDQRGRRLVRVAG